MAGIYDLLKNLRFVKQFTNLGVQDVYEYGQSIKLMKIKQYQRLFNHGDQADSMYIIIQGKFGMFFPKPNYKAVKLEDRTGSRLVSVSSQEARALRTNISLRTTDGWASKVKDNGEDQEKIDDERVAKETFDMLNDLLKNNKEQNQADLENPLNQMKVNDFLKP